MLANKWTTSRTWTLPEFYCYDVGCFNKKQWLIHTFLVDDSHSEAKVSGVSPLPARWSLNSSFVIVYRQSECGVHTVKPHRMTFDSVQQCLKRRCCFQRGAAWHRGKCQSWMWPSIRSRHSLQNVQLPHLLLISSRKFTGARSQVLCLLPYVADWWGEENKHIIIQTSDALYICWPSPALMTVPPKMGVPEQVLPNEE